MEEIKGSWTLFIEFMRRRFPDEQDETYIKEWAERFRIGNQIRYMDNESLRIYKELIKERIVNGLENNGEY